MNYFFQQFWLKAGAIAVLSSLIVLFSWSLLPINTTPPTIAQETPARTLTVTGNGRQSIETTLTEVRLGVEVEGATAREVQQESAQRSTAVVKLLRSRNVQKLETTGIRLQPRYNYSNQERRLIGYQALNLVSFRIATEDIGNLLDEAVKAGATRIDSVGFTATDSAIADAKKQALTAATLDAKAQAEAVLEALDLRSQSIVSIQVDGANPPISPRSELLRTRGDIQATASSSPVIGGEQEITARVTLQIRY